MLDYVFEPLGQVAQLAALSTLSCCVRSADESVMTTKISLGMSPSFVGPAGG